MDKVLFIVGPTASGKSDLAIELAEKNNGEIVNADAMQLYKELSIGVAKVPEEKRKVPHHLLDAISITDKYSVVAYQKEARQAIQDIIQRRKMPIVVGGSGFFIQVLLGDRIIDEFEQENDKEKLAKLSLPELQEIYKKNNPKNEQSIDLNNTRRLISAIQRGNRQKNTVDKSNRLFDSLLLEIEIPRENLYRRINQRVLSMIDEGLEQEARMLFEAGAEELQAGQAIGYKEFFLFFRNQLNIATTIEQIQRDTRRLAKRQQTFFHNQFDEIKKIDGLLLLDQQVIKSEEYVDDWLKQ